MKHFLNTIWSVVLTCGVTLFVSQTQAAEFDVNPTGWYGSIEAAASIPEASGFRLLTGSLFPVASINHSAKYDNGIGSLAALGYQFDQAWRVELELGYRRNDIRSVTPFSGVNGRAVGVSYMGNAIYDIPMASDIMAYAGVGIGGVDFDFKPKTNGAVILRNNDTSIGYQALAGVSYHIAPQTFAFVDYHYLSAPDARITSAQFNQNNRVEFKDHLIGVGLRFYFSPPPSPPQAPPQSKAAAISSPVPAPSKAIAIAPGPRTFLVFFDFDQSTVTPEARRIIESAADWAKKGNVMRIGVTGHTDTMGTATYNQALSSRRADAVRAELLRLGYKGGEISVSGVGFSQPLLQTGPQVREPQNRRAEIVFN